MHSHQILELANGFQIQPNKCMQNIIDAINAGKPRFQKDDSVMV